MVPTTEIATVKLGIPHSIIARWSLILFSGLAGTHQVSNASLAVKLAQTFLLSQESIEPEVPLPQPYLRGLENVRWPGRCQTVSDPNQKRTTWFLDGAHTIESLDCCIRWFVSPGVGLDNS